MRNKHKLYKRCNLERQSIIFQLDFSIDPTWPIETLLIQEFSPDARRGDFQIRNKENSNSSSLVKQARDGPDASEENVRRGGPSCKQVSHEAELLRPSNRLFLLRTT